MPGRDIIVPSGSRLPEQFFELDEAVAIYAWVWGISGEVSIDESFYDIFFEFAREVEYEKRNIELVSDAARILGIFDGTAGILPRQPQLLVIEEFHGDPGAVKASLAQQKSGDGAVHAAAHRNHNPVVHYIIVFTSPDKKPQFRSNVQDSNSVINYNQETSGIIYPNTPLQSRPLFNS
jgi:hypothetical protein